MNKLYFTRGSGEDSRSFLHPDLVHEGIKTTTIN